MSDMITKYVQLWFVVPRHQVEMVWSAITNALRQQGCSFINLPAGAPSPHIPLAIDWADVPANAKPAFARTEAEWEKYCGNRRDIKIVSFVVSGLGRSIEELLQDWQFLGEQGVFVGGSWAQGFDAPDPLERW